MVWILKSWSSSSSQAVPLLTWISVGICRVSGATGFQRHLLFPLVWLELQKQLNAANTMLHTGDFLLLFPNKSWDDCLYVLSSVRPPHSTYEEYKKLVSHAVSNQFASVRCSFRSFNVAVDLTAASLLSFCLVLWYILDEQPVLGDVTLVLHLLTMAFNVLHGTVHLKLGKVFNTSPPIEMLR